jgi:hypothetical protein
MRDIARKITIVLASRYFWYATVGFFVFEAVWIAVSAAFPMAFDEEFHFGIIQLYSEGGPFVAHQPAGADVFGAIFHDPSFLYHYLFSIPYSLINTVIDNQSAIIIFFRFVNIALFAWSLVLFRKLLFKAKMSPAFTHAALAIFVLIPIVPQLAAHINYDNVFILLVAAIGLLVARVLEGLQKRRIDGVAVGALLVLCMASSVVKYESLPIILVVIAFVAFMVYRTFRGFGPRAQKAFGRAWRTLPRGIGLILIISFVVLFGVMAQRYGGNLWTYHSLKPDCGVALSEERCMAYGPWARDHKLELTKGEVNPNPVAYTWTWLQSLHYRLFFAVSGVTNHYVNYPPLLFPAAAAIGIAVMGFTALLIYGRRALKGQPLLVFFLVLSAVYVGALWALRNYPDFLATGQPVAINGRYLIPILLPLAAVLGRCLSFALRPRPQFKAYLAAAAIFMFLYGGGFFTFIIRSDPNWYWHNQMIIDMNNGARSIVKPIVIEGAKYY